MSSKINIDKIFADISDGISLNKACKDQSVSKQTFFNKIRENSELKDQYARAMELRGQKFVESIEEDLRKIENKELDPASGRVIVDTKKWLASKFYPKMYGEKQALEVSGKDGAPLTPPVFNIFPVKGNGKE